MKIRIILPVQHNDFFVEITQKEIAEHHLPTTTVDVVTLGSRGPTSIQCALEEAESVLPVVDEVRKAAQDGCDAVIINCMGDPGLDAARGALRDGPLVVGPCQTAIATVSQLADRFCIVTVLDDVVPLFHKLLRVYHADSRCVGVLAIGVEVLDLGNHDLVRERLIATSRRALQELGAQAIILGCTGFVGMATAVRAALGVPVIDPVPVALRECEKLVMLGLRPSHLAHFPP
eukprot:CAMPEP_0177665234 /NCGR_PEP_ID=MMETSP0447-20121125/20941_1 /TAXON_ID=0 /ORGANISM="Stygamoeba regulata, Strain BSH-02190019" /LENGTH=231 /DNA_ID=CAMNT_0019171305 /DNA_START=59 /DNA_END=750 /DNA_ORIENTATION=+